MEFRYAHPDGGHTDLVFTTDGNQILTCGADGEVRIWDGIEDDNPTSHLVGELTTAIAFHDQQYYVGTDLNAVQAYVFPSGEPNGIITKSTSIITHICISKSGKYIAAGSCDMNIRLVNLSTNTEILLSGHKAPILSIALDSQDTLLVSSSCDGKILVWDITEKKCIHEWGLEWGLLAVCNDFYNSETLCRMAWHPKEKDLLAIPAKKEIKCFKKNKWSYVAVTYTDERIEGMLSVVAFSTCGKYISAGSSKGSLVVWETATQKCISFIEDDRNHAICAIAWNPSKAEVAYCDIDGKLRVLGNISKDTSNEVPSVVNSSNGDNQYNINEDDDDNENSVSISKIKSDLGMLENNTIGDMFKDDDEESRDVDADKASETGIENRIEVPVKSSYAINLQNPFQPGSTPLYLQERFMAWNSVGIMKSYNTEDDNSIDIEFHDASVNHALHISNVCGYTMADVSSEAVLLACEKQEDTPSKGTCMHFSSWDSRKEWSIDMPESEEILAVTLGEGWLALATDKRNLRLYTIGGSQFDVLAIPGPVVCLAGHEDKILVVYHIGLGLPGEQCLSMLYFSVRKRSYQSDLQVALTPKSQLMWFGFSDEGSPITVDTSGVIRILDKHNLWFPLANTRDNLKGKSDYYFVVGVSEIQQNIRCVFCKGAKFPPTLPRPNVTVIPIKIPFCELLTDKGEMEETMRKDILLLQTLQRMDKEGFDIETEMKDCEKEFKECAMKAYALACRTNHEYRASEICSFMPTVQSMQLAIKYASKLGKRQLAEKLNDTIQKKLKEDTVDNDAPNSQGYNSRMSSSLISNTFSSQPIIMEDQPIHQNGDVTLDVDVDQRNTSTSSLNQTSESQSLDHLMTPTPSNHNPFKKTTSESKSKGNSVLDSFQKSTVKKSSVEMQSKTIDTMFTPVCKATSVVEWIKESKEHLRAEHPDMADAELTKLAIKKYRELIDSEKEKYKTTTGSSNKRKFDET